MASEYEETVLMDSPELYWRLGETAEGTVTDYSGNGHDGTNSDWIAGDGVIDQPGLLGKDQNRCVGETAPGLGSAFGYMITGDDAVMLVDEDSDITIEFWCRLDPDPAVSFPFVQAETESDGGVSQWFSQMFEQAGSIIGFAGFRNVNGQAIYSTFTIADDYQAQQWSHLVTVYDSSVPALRIYHNGNLGATDTTKSAAVPNTIATAAEMTPNPTMFFWCRAGFLDEFAIYQSVLSEQRIRAHFRVGWMQFPKTVTVL